VLASQSEMNRLEVAKVREAIRVLEDDPVMAILSSSLDRQAQATEQLARAIREEMASMRRHDSRRFTVMAFVMLVVVLIMGGMVGVTVTATKGDASIHAEPSQQHSQGHDQEQEGS
jgi:hypothetical protein